MQPHLILKLLKVFKVDLKSATWNQNDSTRFGKIIYFKLTSTTSITDIPYAYVTCENIILKIL